MQVPGEGAEIFVEVEPQSRYGWLKMPIEAGGLFRIHVGLTFLSRSQVSPEVVDFLVLFGLARRLGTHRCLLRDLRIGGVEVKDLEVGISPRITPLPVQGVFGLPFLRQFRSVALDLETSRLTLVDP